MKCKIKTNLIIIISALVCLLAFHPAYGSEEGQKYFETPEMAFSALISACGNDDSSMLLKILGNDAENIINTTDKESSRKRRADFCALYREKMTVRKEGNNTAVLLIGKREWPFPVPLVKKAEGWQFDTPAGKRELIYRIIGENELSAIAVCRQYPLMQREYAEIDRNNDGVVEYARKLKSTEGHKDGLYWEAKNTIDQSPAGKFLAMACRHIDKSGKKTVPFNGYYFRILTRQGDKAPGGKYDYIINGHMAGGFALIAYPAKYGVTGIKTFIVNQSGIVHEKDLGEETEKTAEKIIEYNPDKTWTPAFLSRKKSSAKESESGLN